MATKKKLAELLAERAEIQSLLSRLNARLATASRVAEGGKTAEDPANLFAEIESLHDRLALVIKTVNAVNIRCQTEDGVKIADAIVDRDILSRRIATINGAINASEREERGYGSSSVRYVPTIDIAALHEKADELSRQHRALDVRIQHANWNNEVQI